MGDKLLFFLHGLPQVAVKGPLCDIAVNVYLGIFVALPDNAALSLLQVSRPPGTVQVMEGNEAVLDVCSRTHFEGAAQEDADLTAADLGKEGLFPGFGVGVVDERDLIRGDALFNELVPDVLIDGKGRVRLHVLQQIAQGMEVCAAGGPVACGLGGLVPLLGGAGLGGGEVAKDQLGQPVSLPVLPDADHILHAHVQLTVGIVGEVGG